MLSLSWISVALCTLSIIQISFSLTREEASQFESQGIPVILGSDVHGVVHVGSNKDETQTLISNGLPDHGPGILAKKGDKYNVQEQSFRMQFPKNPEIVDNITCVEASSIIGFAINGVPIFSSFDELSNDVNLLLNARSCQGRSNEEGIYYYTGVPNKCSTFVKGYHGHDPYSIYGVAIDGFPIYGPGNGEITNDKLDVCHGKIVDGQYRYYMNNEWPYVLGCFRGTPVTVHGAPKTKGICKYACNKQAKPDDSVDCKDDFPIFHGEL